MLFDIITTEKLSKVSKPKTVKEKNQIRLVSTADESWLCSKKICYPLNSEWLRSLVYLSLYK